MGYHILYATDANYIELCAVSLYSLLACLQTPADVYVIESGLGDRRKELSDITDKFGCKINFIPLDDIKKKLEAASVPPYRGGYAPYARFFISDYISEGRVLYVDCDTLIREDLTPVLNFDLKGMPIGAVIDQSTSRVNPLIGRKTSDRYFNSGILLFDIALCRKENIPSLFLDTALRIDLKNTFLGADQEIMNAAFDGKTATLPCECNMMFTTLCFDARSIYTVSSKNALSYYSAEEFKKAREHPFIIHFAGGAAYQPWREEGVYFKDEDADLWFQYCKTLYPGGRYDTDKLRLIHAEDPKRISFFLKIAKHPYLYSFLKGRYRNIKLIPKRLRRFFL